jgi:hypothetical protein
MMIITDSYFRFTSSDTLGYYYDYSAGKIRRNYYNRVFRDVQLGIILFCLADTTQATSTNRI